MPMNANEVRARVNFMKWGPKMREMIKIAAAASIIAVSFSDTSLADPRGYGKWVGIYIGAHIGGTFTDFKVQGDDGAFDESGPETYAFDKSKVVGGVYGGINHQIGTVVVGVDADVSFGDSEKTILEIPSPDNIVSAKLGTHGTLTARLGLDLGGWMPYVKAGLGWGRVKVVAGDLIDGSDVIDEGDVTRASDTRVGLAIGGGVDVKFTDNLIGRVDYTYMDLGSFSSSNLNNEQFRHSVETHTVRVGISYRWGFDRADYAPLK